MRATCADCALKHISQASILVSESHQGYPTHLFYALGHLAEASDELIKEYPVYAALVREERKRLEADPSYAPNFDELLITIAEKCDICQLEPGTTPLEKGVLDYSMRGARRNPDNSKIPERPPPLVNDAEPYWLEPTKLFGKPAYNVKQWLRPRPVMQTTDRKKAEKRIRTENAYIYLISRIKDRKFLIDLAERVGLTEEELEGFSNASVIGEITGSDDYPSIIGELSGKIPLSNPGNPISWTKCELAHPRVREKILSCVAQIEDDPRVRSPIAVCRASIGCPG